MGLSDVIGMLADLAEVAVTLILAYAVYKISRLIETLDTRIKGDAKG